MRCCKLEFIIQRLFRKKEEPLNVCKIFTVFKVFKFFKVFKVFIGVTSDFLAAHKPDLAIAKQPYEQDLIEKRLNMLMMN